MNDLLYMGLGAVFFILTLGLVKACELLSKGKKNR